MAEATSCKFADGELEPIDTRVAVRFDDVKQGEMQQTPSGLFLPQVSTTRGLLETRNGTVVGVGPNVKQCRVGDRVYVMEHSMATHLVQRGIGDKADVVLVLDEGQLVAIHRASGPAKK